MTRRRLLVRVGVLAFGLGWLALLYASSWHSFFGHSDDANAVLAGHDLITGNVLLSDWTLPFNSYWSIELPLYGLYSVLFGVGPAAIHAVPVIVAAAVVAVGAALARRHQPGWAGWLAAAVPFLLLGLPHPRLTLFFLQGPQHVGTALFCLVAFALLGTAALGWRWWAGVAVLAAAVLGDVFAVAIGVLPVAAAGLLGAARRRRWAPAAFAALAAASALGAAWVAHLAIGGLGGHDLARPTPTSPAWNWLNNVRDLPHLGASLLGRGEDLSGAYETAHLLGVAVVLIGVAWATGSALSGAIRGRPSGADGGWLDDVLMMAFWGGLGAFVVAGLPPGDLGRLRYLLPSLLFGAVLAGRAVARAVLCLHGRRAVFCLPGRRAVFCLPGRRAGMRLGRARVLSVVIAGLPVVGLYLATSLDGVTRVMPPDPARQLAAWLDRRGLDAGVGAYWSASDVTLKSGERVTIRPVLAADGRLRPDPLFASARWHERRTGDPAVRFVVYQPGDPWAGVDDHAAMATFGPASSTAMVGPYRVLIWDRDLSSALTGSG